MENENQNTPETPVVETPVVETPAQVETKVETKVETPAVAVPEGFVKAEDVDSIRAELNTLKSQLETEKANAREASIRSAAQALGFNDPADALLFVGADVTDIEGALASVLESKSYLKKASEAAQPPVTPTNPTNPARGETVTADMLKGMTPAQISKLPWATVSAALKR